jgi:MOSC domain-containing protein YiiM
MDTQTAASVVSVNVGLPRVVEWKGESVSTAIYKHPVSGRVVVRRLDLDGDRQADLTVHGGPDKAIYAYPVEHYAAWRTELPDADLAVPAFGENLTTSGLLEETVQIGDRYRVGTAELMATQPRTPCYKLGIRFGRPDMVRRFHQSGRSGFYFAVLNEGDVAAGDAITLLQRATHSLSVADINRIYAHRGRATGEDTDLMRRASELQALPDGWRAYFQARLARGVPR